MLYNKLVSRYTDTCKFVQTKEEMMGKFSKRMSVFAIMLACGVLTTGMMTPAAYAKTNNRSKKPKVVFYDPQIESKVYFGGVIAAFPCSMYLPKIVDDSTSAESTGTTSIKLSTKATIPDGSNIRYQWYVRLPGEEKFKPIVGALGSVYHYNKCESGEKYSFYVEASNSSGEGKVRSPIVSATTD